MATNVVSQSASGVAAVPTVGGVVVPPPQEVPQATAAAPVSAQPAATYPMASLYVGDLHPDVTEAHLFDKFSVAGPVLSIRVCRDAITRRSLGYAYVNFQQPLDAERALDSMNFDMLNNKAIRIMWSQRDPSIRRSGAGNIFIKNLDKHIDTKSISDTFSMFGTILSCKVATTLDGNSKGYGFIHFETEESALKAIEKVNGMLLDGKKVYVGKFLPRDSRLRDNGDHVVRYTNVFVKNFGDDLNKEKLEKLFSKFGPILSCAVMTDANGKSKGFGFVSFENPEDAEKAVQQMNDYEIEGTDSKLTVCRAQKKSERAADLKFKYEQQKTERQQRYQGVNLYVKNLDDTVNDDQLRQNFETYGKITSAKVMCDENNRSKGFGFVCFEKPDDATKAVVDMNNKMLGSKPLYVALAQRKEDRKAQLASQYMQRLAAMRLQTQIPGMPYNGAQGGFIMPSALQGQRAAAAAFMPNSNAAIAGVQHRGNAQRYLNNINAAGFNPMQSGFMMQSGQFNQVGRGSRGGLGGQMRQPHNGQYVSGGNAGGRPQNRMPGSLNQGPGKAASGVQQPIYPNYPYHHPNRQNFQQTIQPSGGIQVANQEPLTPSMLASASPQEQKQMLGERLYPMISSICKDSDAGKITGMMLEMDNMEILEMFESVDQLQNKVNEAAAVLQSSKGVNVLPTEK